MTNLAITIKSVNGDSYNLNLPRTTTIAEVASKVQVQSGEKYNASNLRLIYAGQDLTAPDKMNQNL